MGRTILTKKMSFCPSVPRANKLLVVYRHHSRSSCFLDGTVEIASLSLSHFFWGEGEGGGREGGRENRKSRVLTVDRRKKMFQSIWLINILNRSWCFLTFMCLISWTLCCFPNCHPQHILCYATLLYFLHSLNNRIITVS